MKLLFIFLTLHAYFLYDISQVFDKKICPFHFMGSMPIINSGIIMGTPLAMMKLLAFFATVSSYLHLGKKYAAGQGILNFAYYYGLFEGMRIKILPPLITPFIHLTSSRPGLKSPDLVFHPKLNPYVNFLEQPYSIIHQIDRKHILDTVWKWQSKTWHTDHTVCADID